MSAVRNRAIVTALLALVLAGFLVGCGAIASAPQLSELKWDSSTILYDRNGDELFRFHAGEDRTPVKLRDVPEHVRKAFIAIEDPNFPTHKGVNLRGIARAAWRSTLYLTGLPGGRLEGGSTITQQLARDAWLNQEVTVKRKLQEAWVALNLERLYTKDEILEMYLNQIYFGQGAYGIDAAAKTFFGKEVGELTVAEGAQLAGMINGPSYYDPYEHPQASLDRRELVLQAMLKHGYIDQDEFDKASTEKVKLDRKESTQKLQGSHFTDYVITILQDAKPGLAKQYGLELEITDDIAKAGLRVYTTLDPTLQKLAEEAVAEQMAAADKQYGLVGQDPRPEAAMVAMNPKTGEVLALVGGRERKEMLGFNRATDSDRQPGSAIKPLAAYVPALEAGLSPATILDDAPVMLTQNRKTVWPQNYDFKYLGLRSMRYGVEQSLNPMAVRAMQAAGGPSRGADSARRFGLNGITKEDQHLALALGGVTNGVKALEMTTAYATLANLGVKVDPVVITKVEDRRGNVLFKAKPQRTRVVSQGIAYMMVDMMKDVIRKGTAYGFTGGFKGWPAAGKTGTTEDNRDGWFIGFTPDLVTTVWNGYDIPENHLKWTAAFVPVKTWNQFMTRAVKSPSPDWERPPEVVQVQVCRATGMLPGNICPKDQVVTELFLAGTEPRSAGNLLVKAKAVQVTVKSGDGKSSFKQWLLWQPGCAGQPVERLFIRRPQPRVIHPTDPWNPRYVPADVADELPTQACQPVDSFWGRFLPGFPILTPPGSETEPSPQPPSQKTPPGGGAGSGLDSTAPGTPGAPGSGTPGTGAPGQGSSGSGSGSAGSGGTPIYGIVPVPPPAYGNTP